MNTVQGSTLASLQAAERFLDAHADVLGSVINTGARRKLATIVADLTGHASDQTGSQKQAQGMTLRTRRLRSALMRDHMAPIARIARAELAQTPQIHPLKMLRGRPTVPKLVAYAEGMAKAAALHSEVFVDFGLPVDFIDGLNAATNDLQASRADHTNLRGNRVVATTSLKSKLSAGRKLVHILDAYVKTALKDNPELLSGWNSVKRVNLVGTRSAPTPPTPDTPTLSAT